MSITKRIDIHKFHQKLISDKIVAIYKPNYKTIEAFLLYLKNEYAFGDPNFRQETYMPKISLVFDVAIRPILKYALIFQDVDLYAKLDHYLFKAYICPIENIHWFEKAFWDVNSYGNALASSLIKESYSQKQIQRVNPSGRVLIVFKGPFQLAHAGVTRDFLEGLTPDQATYFDVLLIDANVSIKTHAKVISLSSFKLTSEKVSEYIKITSNNKYYNIVWVACVQNLMLYMGLLRASKQTYWTMKRHSIVHPSITHYASAVSGHRGTIYNDAYWFGGRYRLKVDLPLRSKEEIIANLEPAAKNLLKSSQVVLGSFARPQKYLSIKYWKGVEHLLSKHPEICFIYGSTQLPKDIQDYIRSSSNFQDRSYNFGWLNGKTSEVCSLIDLYLDNIPFSSGLTAAQTVWSNGVYIGTVSSINKEASFQNILYDAYEFRSKKKIQQDDNKLLNMIGIMQDFQGSLKLASLLITNKELRKQISNNQKNLLIDMNKIGEKYFTSDYADYFRK